LPGLRRQGAAFEHDARRAPGEEAMDAGTREKVRRTAHPDAPLATRIVDRGRRRAQRRTGQTV
jgi:hypothetical protein